VSKMRAFWIGVLLVGALVDAQAGLAEPRGRRWPHYVFADAQAGIAAVLLLAKRQADAAVRNE
jgi:hypothetical protein